MLNVLLTDVLIDYAVCKELKTQPMNRSNDTFRNLVRFVYGRLASLHNLEEVVGGWGVPVEAFRRQDANQLVLSECACKVCMITGAK